MQADAAQKKTNTMQRSDKPWLRPSISDTSW